MATITGLTAERMLEIEGASIVDGEVLAGNLILTKHDGTTIDAGSVIGPQGAAGPVGPASISAIPGEIKLWPGSVLPEEVNYGLWGWADGGVLVVATYPLAAAHIATAWRTFGGASDPGAANFRKPDLRGLVPAGMDAMPGGSRANRMVRAVSITLAGRTGEEQHIVTINEMPLHSHGGGNHTHSGIYLPGGGDPQQPGAGFGQPLVPGNTGPSGNIIAPEGGGAAHENVQPTVFVPYIVKLDD